MPLVDRGRSRSFCFIWVESFFHQSDSNPGWLGTQHNWHRCSVPSLPPIKKFLFRCLLQLLASSGLFIASNKQCLLPWNVQQQLFRWQIRTKFRFKKTWSAFPKVGFKLVSAAVPPKLIHSTQSRWLKFFCERSLRQPTKACAGLGSEARVHFQPFFQL